MPAVSRWLSPALLLLLQALLQPASALRSPQAPEVQEGAKEAAAVEERDVEESDDEDGNEPSLPLSLQRMGIDQEQDERKQVMAMKEYEANLSHTRFCNTNKDKVGALSALLVPSLKLAFCYIPKAACSQFKDLINHLNQLKMRDGFGTGYLRSTASRLGIKKDTVTRENGWKFAVFTRDPALRYLSAFGSTCVSTNAFAKFEHKFECCGPLIKDNTMAPEKIIRMFEQRVDFDLRNGVVSQDDHWVSQKTIFEQCGWDKFDPNIADFHGDVSYGSVNEQVREMLQMVNASDWMLELVDKYFPDTHVAGHTNPLRRIPPEMFFAKKEVLEAIGKIYQEDFEEIPRIGQGFYAYQKAKTEQQKQKEFAKMMPKVDKQLKKLHMQAIKEEGMEAYQRAQMGDEDQRDEGEGKDEGGEDVGNGEVEGEGEGEGDSPVE